ncbi:MAG: NADH-quinone oxidoreductase subunit A [Planctomycetota bacterium]|nr:NADH-quinone oxidoreductase subunit A [Planctomycetota bacterium]MDA1178448.1 NADH-quinone oxidoreductase subunit A [Planctomycetota bacterium]
MDQMIASLAVVNGWGSSTLLVAYMALFAGVGLVFVFVNLLVGRFLRPSNPSPEKLEIYECGEPAIGSSFVQFDLRFYVVALVFIIFDVEVAFLFPWSAVFGKTNHLTDPNFQVTQANVTTENVELTPSARALYRELGVFNPPTLVAASSAESTAIIRDSSRKLLVYVTQAAAFFFVVLLIGFAYEWRTGALDWIRATTNRNQMRVRDATAAREPPAKPSRPIPA